MYAIRDIVRVAGLDINFTPADISVVPLVQRSDVATHGEGGPRHNPDRGDMAELHHALLPSYHRKSSTDGLVVRMFQCDDYALVPPAHANC